MVKRKNDLQACIRDASWCLAKVEWSKKFKSTYNTAFNVPEWYDLCTDHMTDTRPPLEVTVFGVRYDTVVDALKAYGLRDDINYRYHMKQKGWTLEQSLEYLATVPKRGSRAQQRMDREIKSAAHKAGKRLAKVLQDEANALKLRISFWESVKNCRNCSKLTTTVFCSDKCRCDRKLKLEKAKRKKVRELGIDDRGKAHRRHRQVGKGVWDITVTAKSVAIKFGHKCFMCGITVTPHKGKGWQPDGWSVGHIIPVSLGGNTTWDNVRCECVSCNTHKGVRVIDSWEEAA